MGRAGEPGRRPSASDAPLLPSGAPAACSAAWRGQGAAGQLWRAGAVLLALLALLALVLVAGSQGRHQGGRLSELKGRLSSAAAPPVPQPPTPASLSEQRLRANASELCSPEWRLRNAEAVWRGALPALFAQVRTPRSGHRQRGEHTRGLSCRRLPSTHLPPPLPPRPLRSSQRDCGGMPNCPHSEVAALADSYRRRERQLREAGAAGAAADLASLLELTPCDLFSELRDNATLWMIGDRCAAPSGPPPRFGCWQPAGVRPDRRRVLPGKASKPQLLTTQHSSILPLHPPSRQH